MTNPIQPDALPSSDAWSACPAGALVGAARQRRGQQRRAIARRLVAAAALGCALLGGAAGYIGWQRDSAAEPPLLSCLETQALLADYRAARLDAALATRVRTHLARCRHCRELHERVAAPGGHASVPPARAHSGRQPILPFLGEPDARFALDSRRRAAW